jgi:hypothetical protein
MVDDRNGRRETEPYSEIRKRTGWRPAMTLALYLFFEVYLLRVIDIPNLIDSLIENVPSLLPAPWNPFDD